jgi:hypothetical protein
MSDAINNSISDDDQDLMQILSLIDDYRTAHIPSGDWQPVEHPDLSKGEYSYHAERSDILELIIEKIKELPLNESHK